MPPGRNTRRTCSTARGEVARVMQAADGEHMVEARVRERQVERRRSDDAQVAVLAVGQLPPVPDHVHGSLGDVDTVVARAARHQFPAERAVAQADLQHLGVGERMVEIVSQVWVVAHVRIVESAEAFRRCILDAERTRERRTAELVPEGGVAPVKNGLGVLYLVSHLEACVRAR